MSQAHLRLYRWLNQILPYSYTLKFAAVSLPVVSFPVLVCILGLQTPASAGQQFMVTVLMSHLLSYAGLIVLIWHLLAPVRFAVNLFEWHQQGEALPENLPASYDTAGQLISKVAGLLASLESKQQSFDMLFQAIPDGLACFDREGVCLTVKEPSYFNFVYDPQKLVGKTLREYYGDLAARHEYYHQQVWQTGELQSYDFELEVDGQVISREYRIVALSDQESVTFVRDVSEQRRIAKRLETNELTFRTFFEQASTPYVIFHAASARDATTSSTTPSSSTSTKAFSTTASSTTASSTTPSSSATASSPLEATLSDQQDTASVAAPISADLPVASKLNLPSHLRVISNQAITDFFGRNV
ncbi:MAG: PAS domain-containing protein, partial [Deinococcota bacterium]